RSRVRTAVAQGCRRYGTSSGASGGWSAKFIRARKAKVCREKFKRLPFEYTLIFLVPSPSTAILVPNHGKAFKNL
ncbi:MAG: hypothetical protein M1608_15585, partial [Candidatus Omnitrophica bacterium]|nr:hypothetical protein [Candidatus Omnitrophota bacterium]